MCLDDGVCGCNWVKQQAGDECTAGAGSVLPLINISTILGLYLGVFAYYVRLIFIKIKTAGAERCRCTATSSTLMSGCGAACALSLYMACEIVDVVVAPWSLSTFLKLQTALEVGGAGLVLTSCLNVSLMW